MNMTMTPQNKKETFPIALIFAGIHIVVLIIYILTSVSSVYMYLDFSFLQVIFFIVNWFFDLIPYILIFALLLMKKRNFVLCIPFVLLCLQSFAIMDHSVQSVMYSYTEFYKLINFTQTIVYFIANVYMFVLIGFTYYKPNHKLTISIKKAWFVSGILYIVASIMGMFLFDKLSMFIMFIDVIPMYFLLGWWITHPYKKEQIPPLSKPPIPIPPKG